MSILQTLGWTFLHALWQGAAIALAAWSLLGLCRSARGRYAIGIAGLMAMLIGPAITFGWLLGRPAELPRLEPVETVAVASLEQPLAAIPIDNAPAEASVAALSTRSTSMVIWLGRGWIAGVLLVAAWNAAGVLQIGRLRREAILLEEPEWTARLMRLIRRFHLHRNITLLVTDRIDCPAVVGWLKPVILWPSAALIGLTPKQIDALLAHELAHICRHDHLVNFAQAGVETLLFFHPCMWWLSRRVRQERENCCDDLAAQLLGSRVEYAEALVAMESLRQAPALSLSANGGSLMKRIQRLLEPTSPALVRARSAPAAILLLAGLVTVSLWTGRVAPSSAEPSTQPTTEVANANADANSLRSLMVDVVNARNALRELRETKSAFAPEVAQAREREQETMQKWMSRLFEICGTDEWQARIDEELKSIWDANVGQQPLVSRGDLGEIISFALREARLQLGQDSNVHQRLSETYDKLRTAIANPKRIELASADPFYARLENERETAELELARLRSSMGENSPMIKKLRNQAELLQKRMEEMAAKFDSQALNKDLQFRSKQASELGARAAEAAEALLQKQTDIQQKLEVAKKTLSEASPTIAQLRSELDAIDATVRALFKEHQATARAEDSTYARYLRLTKDRDDLTAAIEKRRADPTTNADQLAELEGLLRAVNLQIGGMTNIGEVYVAGKIARPGVYSISGRQITLKQMLISAGLVQGPDDELICVVRRDPSGRSEETLYRQMSELFKNDKPVGSEGGDLHLRADDQVIVGAKRPATATEPATQPGN